MTTFIAVAFTCPGPIGVLPCFGAADIGHIYRTSRPCTHLRGNYTSCWCSKCPHCHKNTTTRRGTQVVAQQPFKVTSLLCFGCQQVQGKYKNLHLSHFVPCSPCFDVPTGTLRGSISHHAAPAGWLTSIPALGVKLGANQPRMDST